MTPAPTDLAPTDLAANERPAAAPGSNPGAGHMLGVLFCLFAATAWGTTGTAATFAPGVGPLAIGAAAMGFGGLLQAFVARRGIRAHWPVLRARLPLLALGAVAVAVYPLAFYASMRLAGVTIGTVISIGAAPVISALIENRLEGRRLTLRWAIGAAIGLSGIALLSMTPHAPGSPVTGASGTAAPDVALGAALGLLAAATYALYSWTSRRLMHRAGGHAALPSRVAMGATFGLGGLLLMPVLAATGAAFLEGPVNLAVGLYMAVVPMFLGYLAFGAGLARVPASTATTITLFEPVVAAILAIHVVGEMLTPRGWLGVALVIACLLWTSWPMGRARRCTRKSAAG
ncbi:DME family drug/metabolite transporter [Brevirhabdus pacifica]|nr:EamA family transporter [Brevirhabdus pacifica]PJJ86220.1 DME family drug/metabolite transporter [Brevirhabdus pacifica]